MSVFLFKKTMWPFFTPGTPEYHHKRQGSRSDLNEFDKLMYDWGIDVITKNFGVTIAPQQPRYKKYWGYLLGALGICVGTYCYVKYAQKGASK